MNQSGRGWVLLGWVLMSGVLYAHDVTVVPHVLMTVDPAGDRLVVRMHIPAALIGRAPLDVLAADTARNLDVQQDGNPLPAATATATASPDRTSADVEVTYRIDAGRKGISARLNGFASGPAEPTRTTVRYQPAAGPLQIVSVTGRPTRVRFDPGILETCQEFMARALRSVLIFGDHLLLLACLLMPARSARDAARLFAGLAGGQAVGMTLVALSGTTPAFSLTVAMVAASTVVVAAVQNIVRARVVLVAMLALAFGVLNGLAFGETFAMARQFAGTHQAIAFAVFVGAVIVAEFWLGAVAWATRAWLERRHVPARAFAIIVSTLIAHTAVHDVLDRGHALATGGTFAAERAIVWLTLAWAVVMLVVATVEWLRHRASAGQSVGRPIT